MTNFSCRHLSFVISTAHLYADINGVPLPKPIDVGKVKEIIKTVKVPEYIPSNKVSVTILFQGPAFQKIVSLMESLVKGLLTLLHSERPKLYTILAFLSAVGLNFGAHIKSNVITLLAQWRHKSKVC